MARIPRSVSKPRRKRFPNQENNTMKYALLQLTAIVASVHLADLFTRPDGTDLNAVRPYKDEVAWIKSHLDDVFARYIRCGITSVVDVGGPMWNFEVRKKANATAKAPRVAVAGPLISSVSREKLDLGDPPIVKIDTPDQARDFVRKLAE